MNTRYCRSCSAIAGLVVGWFCLLAIEPTHAGPIFSYQFPASWDGVSATITDLSSAGNNSAPTGAPVLSSNVPPGAPAGAMSINTVGGGFRTDNASLLTNAAIAAAGGYRFDTTFLWDGTNNSFSTLKILDYAGTEFLQLQGVDVGAGTATLRFGFNDDTAVGVNLQTTVSANQWYEVSGVFDAQGNAVAPDGSLSGQATLIVNGQSFTDSVVKTNFGDGLNRRIGVGNFPGSSGKLIEFHGDVYSASVQLIPEPATILSVAWCTAVAVGFARRRRMRVPAAH